MKTQIQWMTASPLWDPLVKNGPAEALRQPALLRFDSDTFMEDLEVYLKKDPIKLANLLARPESFQARPLGKSLNWTPPPPAELKLYQPAHGHFYLVAGSLVCRLPGLPDRKIYPTQDERASFVLRRLVPVEGTTPLRYAESAWVVRGEAPGWQEVKSPRAVLENEERLPLFGINFAEGDRTRRLLTGYIPVASRETFQAAPELSPAELLESEGDPRLAELQTRVFDPLNELAASDAGESEAQQVSLFILLDLADFLQINMPEVWAPIVAPSDSWPGPSEVKKNLFDQLGAWTVDGTVTWRDALFAVWRQRDSINSSGVADNPKLTYNLKLSDMLDVGFFSLALDPQPSTPESEIRVPKIDPIAGDLYVLRCVYERPRCVPFHPPVVSEPSKRFQLAPFFDSDAPARPIRITLPIDTSIAGLRKFNKNVAFIMSDKLRRQMSRLSKKTLTEGEAEEGDSFTLGSICSFSISIIFICAFVLLLIIAIALNIVFWWMAFFKICIPIPVKKKTQG